jgi:hypothetical protein
MSDEKNVPLKNEGVEYEEKDLKVGWLAGSAVAILLVTIGAMAVLAMLLGGLETRREALGPTPLPLINTRPTPPSPRLQPNPIDGTTAEEQLIEMQEDTEKVLTTYGWVDEENGIARVPIDTAIEILTPEDGEPPK